MDNPSFPAIKTLQDLYKLPADSFYVTVNGKEIVDWQFLHPDVAFDVHFRLRGGKGGFGSLLRSFRIHRSTNQLMCRDLTGRRLADVKEEEKLRKWIEKAAEREEAKRRKRQEKYEKLKGDPPKHEFSDQTYIETREKILDETNDAFEIGLASLSKTDENGKPNGKTNVDSGGDKGYPLKKLTQLADQESDSDLELTDDEDVPGPSGFGISKRKNMNGTEEELCKKQKLIEKEELDNNNKSGVVEKEIQIEKKNDEGIGNSVVNESEKNKCEINAKFDDINLDEFESVEQLEALGLKHLKYALEIRGLKCGGSLNERAARLFSVKGLEREQYPKCVMANTNRKH